MPAAHVPRPYVQCQRRIPDARTLTGHAPTHMLVASAPHAPVHMPVHLRPYVPVKPRESALIPAVMSRLPEARPASPRPGPLTSDSFLGHRLPSQTNTSLFCTLCPHSYAPGKNFPVGHPSPNFSGPSTLNLGVLWRPASGKEVATCWYEYPINPIKPWAGVSH